MLAKIEVGLKIINYTAYLSFDNIPHKFRNYASKDYLAG